MRCAEEAAIRSFLLLSLLLRKMPKLIVDRQEAKGEFRLDRCLGRGLDQVPHGDLPSFPEEQDFPS